MQGRLPGKRVGQRVDTPEQCVALCLLRLKAPQDPNGLSVSALDTSADVLTYATADVQDTLLKESDRNDE